MLSIISNPFLQDDVIVTLIVPLLTNGFFLLRPDICAFISKLKVCMEEKHNFFFFFLLIISTLHMKESDHGCYNTMPLSAQNPY